MKRNWLTYLGLIFGLVVPARAAMVFTNITAFTAQAPVASLTGVAYDGSNTFVVAGLSSNILTAKFLSSGTGGLLYARRALPSSASLYAATHGGDRFVVGGVDAATFYSTDGTNWVKTSINAFQNPAAVRGLAYNPGGQTFAAVASIVNASWANSSLAWANSTIAGGYALESFRGVTAVGSGEFAACGIAGTIRKSVDGGVTWTPVRPWSSTEPSLLGIASDGGQRVVAVGAGGRLMYSTNGVGGLGGANWYNAATNSVTHIYNAVAYTGSEFIAVGNGGQIFTSPDGIVWSLQTDSLPPNSLPVTNLLGVAFATAGELKGIGLVVGEGGTVMLGGTRPPAPVSLGDQSTCEGSPNPPLCASVTNAVDHPPGTVVIDWYTAATGGSPVANNLSCYIPTDTAAGGPSSASNYTYFAEARDIRTGFVSTNRTPVFLTINPRPTAVVSGSTAICNGGSTVIQALLTGLGPWSVIWSSNGVPMVTNIVSTGSNPDTLTVSPANPNPNAPVTNTYTVTALIDLGATTQCPANPGDLTGSAVVRINPRPTAVVSGTTAICNGDSTVVQAALTGIGPWTVTWSDGTVSNAVASPATKIVGPANPNPNAPVTNTYTVTALIDLGATTQCPANAGDLTGSAVIRVNPRPTSVVSGTTAICNGDSTVVQAVLTGIGPWTVTWSDGTVSNAVASPATKIVSPVNPNPNTPLTVNYTVTALIDLGAGTQCPAGAGDRTGIAAITVNPRPTAVVSGTTAICNGDSTTVQAALTGIGPWTVTWSDGTVSNAVASPATKSVSPANPNPNTPVTNTYTVTALVDLGAATQCPATPGDLTGNAVIRINPRPTAVVSGTTAICNGDSTVVQAALTGIGPWTVTWSDGTVSNAVASPATKSVSPANPNPNAPVTNTYTVAALIDLGSTTQCPANPGELTGSAVIRINPRPTAVVSGTTAICNGDSTVVQAALTGIGPWTVTWSDGTVSNAVASPATKIVSPANPNPNAPVTNTYTVTALIDLGSTTLCPANPGNLTGSAVIRVNPRPTAVVSGTTAICNGDSTVLQAALTGIGPWTVTWSDGTVSNAVASPATKIVSPANPNPNTSVTNSYAVTALIDQGSTTQCPANPGALTGSAVIRVNPRPTAVVSGSTNILVDSTNFVTAEIRADLTGFGPWTLLWSDGVGQTNISSPALRTVTNQLTSATNITYTLQSLPNGSSFVTNNIEGALVYPNPPYAGDYYLEIGNKKYFVTATNVTTSPLTSATFTYSVTNLTDLDLNGCVAGPADLVGAAVVTLTAQIGAHVYTFGTTNLCAGDVTTILADLTGTPPWTIRWSDGTTMTNITNSPVNYLVHPSGAGSYSYSITNLTDAVTNAFATNLTGVVTVTVYEVPTNPPVSSGNQTNCVGMANPALVIPGTNSIIWFDSNTNLVASYTNSFVPNDTAPGSWVYYAAEVNSNGCVGPFTTVNLVLLACTNPPTIQWNGTNGTVEWFGNLTLLSSTNLTPPVTWTVLTNGLMQTNIWNWTNTTPPIQFFRLTNSP